MEVLSQSPKVDFQIGGNEVRGQYPLSSVRVVHDLYIHPYVRVDHGQYISLYIRVIETSTSTDFRRPRWQEEEKNAILISSPEEQALEIISKRKVIVTKKEV